MPRLTFPLHRNVAYWYICRRPIVHAIELRHGAASAGPPVHDAFDEPYIAGRTCMCELTTIATGQKLHRLPETARRRRNGPRGEKPDAWRRVLDREEPDHAR